MSPARWHGIQPSCGSRRRALFRQTITKQRAKHFPMKNAARLTELVTSGKIWKLPSWLEEMLERPSKLPKFIHNSIYA